ncbi:MAG: helix-turn-helix domain-containing protein [Vicingaceae bacterium]|jgi:DNA-binding HxlR family transcriptional regulator
MNKKFRSSCVIASCLDLIGDKWSLLIIRDMLLNKKISFKQIVSSEEGIATNLLSSRLKLLESLEVITKRKLPENKKENLYLLTEKGIELAPLIFEIVIWSDKYVREYNKTMNAYDAKNASKSVIVSSVQNEYRELVQKVLRQARNSSD